MEGYFREVIDNKPEKIKLNYKETFITIKGEKEVTNMNIFFNKSVYDKNKNKFKFFVKDNIQEITKKFLLYYYPELYNISKEILITRNKMDDSVLQYINVKNILFSKLKGIKKVNNVKLINVMLDEGIKKDELESVNDFIKEKLLKNGRLVVNMRCIMNKDMLDFLCILSKYFKDLFVMQKPFDNYFLFVFGNYNIKKLNENKSNSKVKLSIKYLFDFDVNDNLEEIYNHAVQYSNMLSLNKLEEYNVKKQIFKNYKLKDLYFPLYFDNKLYNNDKFEVTDEGLFSVTPPVEANLFSLIIKNVFPKSNIIMDGTANCGGNTISFSKFFTKVISIELNEENYNALKINTGVYNLDNVKLILGSTLDYYKKLKYDILFLDPPWGGKNYKKHTVLDLKIGNKDIKEIIHDLKKLGKKGLVFKLPYNFNLTQNYMIGNYLSIIKIKNYYCVVIKF